MEGPSDSNFLGLPIRTSTRNDIAETVYKTQHVSNFRAGSEGGQNCGESEYAYTILPGATNVAC